MALAEVYGLEGDMKEAKRLLSAVKNNNLFSTQAYLLEEKLNQSGAK